jgi:hypothetical protein
LQDIKQIQIVMQEPVCEITNQITDNTEILSNNRVILDFDLSSDSLSVTGQNINYLPSAILRKVNIVSQHPTQKIMFGFFSLDKYGRTAPWILPENTFAEILFVIMGSSNSGF